MTTKFGALKAGERFTASNDMGEIVGTFVKTGKDVAETVPEKFGVKFRTDCVVEVEDVKEA